MRDVVLCLWPDADRDQIAASLQGGGDVILWENIPRSIGIRNCSISDSDLNSIPGVKSWTADVKAKEVANQQIPYPIQENTGQLAIPAMGSTNRLNPYLLQAPPGQAALWAYDPTVAPGDGTGVNFYGMDSGIRSTHEECGLRFSSQLADTQSGGITRFHGTSVMDAAVGETLGLAPGATIFDTRVSDTNGTANIFDFNTCFSAVVSHHTNTSTVPGVLNVSFEAFASSNPFEANIDSAINAGIVVVVAAGNSGLNLDLTSGSGQVWPAEDPDAITVGALTLDHRIHPLSNFGSPVDAYGIYDVWRLATADADDHYRMFVPGTSFASPQIAGMVCRALTGATKMTTRSEVETFKDAFLADYCTGLMYAQNGDDLIPALQRRLIIPGVTFSGYSAYTPPTRSL